MPDSSTWKLPLYSLHTHEEDEKKMIYDPIRKAWFVYQPEEVVRQHLIQYLIQEKNISPNLISVEKELRYRGTKRRFDVVVFDRSGSPEIVCECKAPEVPITQDTVNQIARYNTVLKAPHLLLTNGKGLVVFSIQESGKYVLNKDW